MTTIAPGRQMNAEMDEQVHVLTDLARRWSVITDEVAELCVPGTAGVAFLARGSSDNAALLGRYAVGVHTGLPTCLIAPSLHTGYRAPAVGFERFLVIALSQSGQTPEIVDVAGRYRDAGARVVAVTNDERSALANAADLTVALDAGPELAVPATKTVSAQMLAVLAVVNGLARARSSTPVADPADIDRLPELVRSTLSDGDAVEAAVSTIGPADRLVVAGRGYLMAAASETALKLQETAGVLAHAFSTADLRHGPIAATGPGVASVLLVGTGPVDGDTLSLREDLLRRGSPVTVFGSAAGADVPWPATEGVLDAIAATVRGQQLALRLCRARGIDPDHPDGLNKITLTH